MVQAPGAGMSFLSACVLCDQLQPKPPGSTAPDSFFYTSPLGFSANAGLTTRPTPSFSPLYRILLLPEVNGAYFSVWLLLYFTVGLPFDTDCVDGMLISNHKSRGKRQLSPRIG